MAVVITEKKAEVDAWVALLEDITALLACPGVHHKLLLQRACALHTSQIVNAEEYSADGALAYAIEEQLYLPASAKCRLMQVLVIPMRRKDIALEPRERERYEAIQGNVIVRSTHCEYLGRHANIA
ncbi:hypothetical protein [Pseudomonas syringae group genomosp. 3]